MHTAWLKNIHVSQLVGFVLMFTMTVYHACAQSIDNAVFVVNIESIIPILYKFWKMNIIVGICVGGWFYFMFVCSAWCLWHALFVTSICTIALMRIVQSLLNSKKWHQNQQVPHVIDHNLPVSHNLRGIIYLKNTAPTCMSTVIGTSLNIITVQTFCYQHVLHQWHKSSRHRFLRHI